MLFVEGKDNAYSGNTVSISK